MPQTCPGHVPGMFLIEKFEMAYGLRGVAMEFECKKSGALYMDLCSLPTQTCTLACLSCITRPRAGASKCMTDYSDYSDTDAARASATISVTNSLSLQCRAAGAYGPLPWEAPVKTTGIGTGADTCAMCASTCYWPMLPGPPARWAADDT